MPNLIDNTYFKADRCFIAQLDQANVATSLLIYINKFEPEYLEKVLGYESQKALLAAPAEARWVDVLGGKEYTNTVGELKKWRGLVNSTLKLSPIANYVFYWWMRQNATTSSGTGEHTIKSDKAIAHSPSAKATTAWNEMVTWNKELWDFLYYNKEVYYEFWRSPNGATIANLRRPIFL